MKIIIALLLVLLLVLGACGRTEPVQETRPGALRAGPWQMHPDMGEFSFTLRGVYYDEVNGVSEIGPYDAFIGFFKVSSIEIQEEGGSFRQVLELENSRGFMPFECNLQPGHFNNDDYLDFQLQLVENPGRRRRKMHSFSWLWDNEQGEFVQKSQYAARAIEQEQTF